MPWAEIKEGVLVPAAQLQMKRSEGMLPSVSAPALLPKQDDGRKARTNAGAWGPGNGSGAHQPPDARLTGPRVIPVFIQGLSARSLLQ